jgi:hypothetical protein
VTDVGLCAACKKIRHLIWTCVICESDGLLRGTCSIVCKRKHERDGRHRKIIKLKGKRSP